MLIKDDRGRTVDVESAVAQSLESSSWEGGAFERARDQAENNSRAIGTLTALLVERGLMSAEELQGLLSWRYKVEESSDGEG